MKQIIQRLNSKLGVDLMEMPAPINAPGHVLIRTTRTLVSKGTESKLVEFGNLERFSNCIQMIVLLPIIGYSIVISSFNLRLITCNYIELNITFDWFETTLI